MSPVDAELTVGSALGVDGALAVLVRQLFGQLIVLQQNRPAHAVAEFWLSPTGLPAVGLR